MSCLLEGIALQRDIAEIVSPVVVEWATKPSALSLSISLSLFLVCLGDSHSLWPLNLLKKIRRLQPLADKAREEFLEGSQDPTSLS